MLLQKFSKELILKNRSKRTIESIKQILGDTEEKLKKPLEELTMEELKNHFIKERKRGLHPNTILLKQRKFIQFFEWCFDETSEDKYSLIARKLRKIKMDKVKTYISPSDILLPEDIKKLINVATLERDRCMIAVLFESGIRLGELLALKNDMIEMDELKQEVRLNIPNVEGCKTGARSVICLEIYGYVQDWMKCNTSDKFIILSISGISKTIRLLFKKAGITKPCNIHHFRHSAITHAAGLNMSETQLSYRFWGIPHSSMLSVYIHLNEQLKSSGYRDAKGMGDNVNCKTIINPLASRCVECGRLIQSGDLCKTCKNSKNLSKENSALKAQVESTQKQIETMQKDMEKIQKFIDMGGLNLLKKE